MVFLLMCRAGMISVPYYIARMMSRTCVVTGLLGLATRCAIAQRMVSSDRCGGAFYDEVAKQFRGLWGIRACCGHPCVCLWPEGLYVCPSEKSLLENLSTLAHSTDRDNLFSVLRKGLMFGIALDRESGASSTGGARMGVPGAGKGKGKGKQGKGKRRGRRSDNGREGIDFAPLCALRSALGCRTC